LKTCECVRFKFDEGSYVFSAVRLPMASSV
jgi:hypothetical protein